MYFLRRRHGRKPPSEARRETPPAEAPTRYETLDPEPDQIAPARPTVITKTKRPRVASASDDNCKPAGTFRAGTLHLDRSAEPQSRHGKL